MSKSILLTLIPFMLSANYVLTPDGNYVAGNSYTMTPNGTYVSGTTAQLTPEGKYIGSAHEIPNKIYIKTYQLPEYKTDTPSQHSYQYFKPSK